MFAIDMLNEDAEFHVFVAVLFHDLGKGTTPKDVLPSHSKHEMRSLDLVEALMEDHRFSKKARTFSILFARQHMRMNAIEEMTARKLVKFLGKIPKHFRVDFLEAAKSYGIIYVMITWCKIMY